MAEKSYIEQREGVYRVGDTRVSLDSIVYAFLEGHTAESIQQSFPHSSAFSGKVPRSTQFPCNSVAIPSWWVIRSTDHLI
jgi:hypothetical protein